MKLIRPFYCLLFLFYVSLTFSQVSIEGTLINSETDLTVENASVYIQNSTIGTISNSEGDFYLKVPEKYKSDTLIISSIGYKKTKISLKNLNASIKIYMEPSSIILEEVIITSEKPLTGIEILNKALENYELNFSTEPFIAKTFIRHSERNSIEYKWLIENAASIYFPGINNNISDIEINIDQTRKSYDDRSIDSTLLYRMYLANKIVLKRRKLKKALVRLDENSISEAINWNDLEYNNIEYLIKGPLNIVRNRTNNDAIFGKEIFKKHKFTLDATYWQDDRKLYKIKISPNKGFVDLRHSSVYNEGFVPIGWIYIFGDTFSIKEIDYALVAGSKSQKARSKTIFNTTVMHRINLKYKMYNNKMYPEYFSYSTPKVINYTFKKNGDVRASNDNIYYTKQEILFNEIIQDSRIINKDLQNNNWDSNIFSKRPFVKTFWDNYNILLETNEEILLINKLEETLKLQKQNN